MQPEATAASGGVMRSPSPNFSSLSPDELDQLETVLRKQVLIENEQNQRLSGLRRTMVHLQHIIENDHQQQRNNLSTNSYGTSSVQEDSTLCSSLDMVRCYICSSNIEIQPDNSTSILCTDCHQTVCQRCGNYTSPELIHISNKNNPKNQTERSKWRCRMCVVRREVIRKSGSWNTMDNDISIQSPVRLLQKLIAYRESISSTTTSSSQTERKSTILSESTKFFTRLWRLHDSNAKPSETLMISRETTSSSFDHISELSPTFVDTTLTLPPSSKSNRRMSFIRDISLKNSPQSPTLSPSLLIESSLPFQSQSPTLNTITNQSFNDISPEHRARKLYSQNLETNIDNSHLKTLNERQTPQEQQELINKKRDHHLNLSTTSFIPSVQKLSSLSMQRTDEHRASFTSPEANIDVSKHLNNVFIPITATQSIKNNNTLSTIENLTISNKDNFQQINHSDFENSDTRACKRALMGRNYQWTTTLKDDESTANNNHPYYRKRTFITNTDEKRSSSSTKIIIESASSISNRISRRRRSSRLLPAIPSNSKISANDQGITNHSNNIKSTSLSLTSNKHPLHSIDKNCTCNSSTYSKSMISNSLVTPRPLNNALLHKHSAQDTKSIDLSNLTQQKPFLNINDSLLTRRSQDYPCILRKTPDLSDIVRQRMLYTKLSKQKQENFSMSLEREHVPKVPKKIIVRQDNSLEIALSKPPKLRQRTLSDEHYYGYKSEIDYASKVPTTSTMSTLGLPVSPCESGLSSGDRRKTIETCENIYLHVEESSKLRARTPPSNPHRVLLHRCKNDTSIRTGGLGMRIVGGQECEDGSLGCFVTNVLYGGPAHIQGNIEVGDQILEFNGHSLIESTYEEVRILQDHCGDIVQLVVQHNNVRLQINNGQALSSVKISRHYETVPCLSSSMSQKRRNLPPLPSFLLPVNSKQLKKELYETVETIEVPNVKELKPILINHGRLLAQIWHDVDDKKLALTIIQAGNLPLRPNGDQPYAFITGKIIFEDRGFDMFETKIIRSSNPVYNETFVFYEVETVDCLHLEVLMWDKKQSHRINRKNYENNTISESDEFLGMIQLPLNEANLEDEPRWYELYDCQTRKALASTVTFKPSAIDRDDSFRKMTPSLKFNKCEEEKKLLASPFTHPLPRSTIEINDTNRRNSFMKTRTQNTTNSDDSTIPTITMTTIDDAEQNQRDTPALTVQSVKFKRRISEGISKLFDVPRRRFSELTPKLLQGPLSRKLSSLIHTSIDAERHLNLPVTATLESTNIIVNKSPRHSSVSTTNQDEPQKQQTSIRSIPLQQVPIGQLMLPYISSSRHSSMSGSRKSSGTSNFDSDDDIDRYFTLAEQQEQEIENSSVQTHTVGPGQVTPRNYENMIHDFICMGQIQIGLIVTKGLLEIDIICARELECVINENARRITIGDIPPDTYAKTYLRAGTRRVQKRKTATIKGSFNPEYHSKLKYDACNVMGRRLEVTVWQRRGKFEKNQCIGEAFIELDSLTLNQHTLAWYKLFRKNLVETDWDDSS